MGISEKSVNRKVIMKTPAANETCIFIRLWIIPKISCIFAPDFSLKILKRKMLIMNKLNCELYKFQKLTLWLNMRKPR